MEQRLLFGGAIEASLPTGFLDASDFRQIPDNQEVFTADGATDVSIVFEIVELQAEVPNSIAGRYFWRDFVQSNEAAGEQIKPSFISMLSQEWA